MKTTTIILLALTLKTLTLSAQVDATFLKANAARIDNTDNLSDSVYQLLTDFQIIMVGELHGTNEPAQFVIGLANLLTKMGDSVSVGLEIPDGQMTQFLEQKTDSSIFASDFFLLPGYEDGRASVAWAGIISKLKDNPKVDVFFYDANAGEGESYERDKIMSKKVLRKMQEHPTWKVITIGGNFHNNIYDGSSLFAYLNENKSINLTSKICSLNVEYLEGSCRANFGNGLEENRLRHQPGTYDTTFDFERYLVLIPSKFGYAYHGFFYTKFITAAEMALHEK